MIKSFLFTILVALPFCVNAQVTLMHGSFSSGAGTGSDGDYTLQSSFTPFELQVSDVDLDGYNVDLDCDDSDPTTYPGAPELCDLKDNNCDGVIDEGCVATISISSNSIEIPNAQPTPFTFGFGDVDAGTSLAIPFTLTNTGNASLLLSSVIIDGLDAAEFTTDLPNGNVTILPNEVKAFSITFSPSGEGVKSATITLISNAADTPFAFHLTGNGKIVPLPKQPASELEVAVAEKSAIKLQFKKGDGMKRAVLMKEVQLAESKVEAQMFSNDSETSVALFSASALSGDEETASSEEAIPVIDDNTVLMASANFLLAAEYKGYKVVYDGEGSEVHVTNLQPSKAYMALVYEYNELESLKRYLYPPAELKFQTLPGVSPPATGVSSLAVHPTSASSIFVTFTPGDGQNRLAVMRQGVSPAFQPEDDSFYIIGQVVQEGETIVYVGTGSSFEIFDLQDNTTYYVTVYEYNADGEYSAYLTENITGAFGKTYEIPTATLSGDEEICSGEEAYLQVVLTGYGPWTGSYRANNGDNIPFSTTTPGETSYTLLIPVEPTQTSQYELTSLSDAFSVGTFSGEALVTVNTPPVIVTFDVPINPQPISTPVVLSGSFNDNNISHMVLDWGDASGDQFAEIESLRFGAQHSYSSAGVYTLTASLIDLCGEVAEYLHQYVVVYDPSAGFVTGGGWFTSPAGAYVHNSDATGRASFGFVSKYKKGSTVPDGDTDFQFQAGNLKFKSTAYKWLVIAGHKAMYSGVGELNGIPGYGFLISAVDGNKKSTATPDKFRIKIWDAANAVVYDNQMDDADDAEATTMLGGGSIVIHDGKSTFISSTTSNESVSLRSEGFATIAHPNPFSNSFTLEYQTDRQEALNIQLLDVTGKSVYDQLHSTNSRGIYSVQLNEDATGPGLYILKINQGNRVEFLRLIRK